MTITITLAWWLVVPALWTALFLFLAIKHTWQSGVDADSLAILGGAWFLFVLTSVLSRLMP